MRLKIGNGMDIFIICVKSHEFENRLNVKIMELCKFRFLEIKIFELVFRVNLLKYLVNADMNILY